MSWKVRTPAAESRDPSGGCPEAGLHTCVPLAVSARVPPRPVSYLFPAVLQHVLELGQLLVLLALDALGLLAQAAGVLLLQTLDGLLLLPLQVLHLLVVLPLLTLGKGREGFSPPRSKQGRPEIWEDVRVPWKKQPH